MKQVSHPSFCPVNLVAVGRAAAGVMGDQRPILSTNAWIPFPYGAGTEADFLTFKRACKYQKLIKLVSDP